MSSQFISLYLLCNNLELKCMEDNKPRICKCCNESFTLDNVWDHLVNTSDSKRLHPDSVFCGQCVEKVCAEIEEDDRWETINNEISNALYDLEDEENLKSRLSEDNILKILKIAQRLN